MTRAYENKQRNNQRKTYIKKVRKTHRNNIGKHRKNNIGNQHRKTTYEGKNKGKTNK